MNAVAAGFGTDIDHRIAGAGGGGIKNLVGLGQADGHRVYQDIAVIGGVEIDLAGDRRHANTITVTADTGDHAAD